MDVPLVNFDGSIHSWKSLAEEQLPLCSHKFDEAENSLRVLDQRLLPHRTEFVPIQSIQDGFDAIKEMKVRGAPLIATVGMLTLLVDQEAQSLSPSSAQAFAEELAEKCKYLMSARPTAINLTHAFTELLAQVEQRIGQGIVKMEGLNECVRNFVLEWQARERRENDLLLRNSIVGVLGAVQAKGKSKLVAMTICNTGQLATSSFGTALGVILMLHRLGHLDFALVLETRPYNQGSRLTSYELQQGGVPFKLIPDSAAAAAMRHFDVDFVAVGADQVALNGDTANKIGTYSLAINAKAHGIPFFVVTPIASVNARLADGRGIRVEERPAHELTHWNGISHCLAECPVWNPAFDITPGQLVSGFLTERGNFTSAQLAEALFSPDEGGAEKDKQQQGGREEAEK